MTIKQKIPDDHANKQEVNDKPKSADEELLAKLISNSYKRREARSTLEAKFESPREVLSILKAAFKHPNPRVREEVLSILKEALVDYIYEPKDIQEFYRVASESPYEDVRIKAKEIFEKLLSNGIQ